MVIKPLNLSVNQNGISTYGVDMVTLFSKHVLTTRIIKDMRNQGTRVEVVGQLPG